MAYSKRLIRKWQYKEAKVVYLMKKNYFCYLVSLERNTMRLCVMKSKIRIAQMK